MTKVADARCPICRVRVPTVSGKGRPRTFCSPSCRQRMWVARQGSTELERSEFQLREIRGDLDSVLDEVSGLLDALEAVWAVDQADPLRHRLESVVRESAIPLIRRLRR